jgi:hypothetical protein
MGHAATIDSRSSEERSAPATIARYELLEELGAGGMGAVHRARDRSTGKIVALKQLSSSLAGPKRRMLEALFEREYHTLIRLKHPRIIAVYDYGLSPSGPYYTMELLDGQDLQQLAPLPYREACRYLRDVASSLALIHAHRLVHRDVSPRNVRLTADGRAKLIDFGALTAFGPAADLVGTPLCMPPEAVRRLGLDQRTDLYALGAVAYCALTGRHAYPARRVDELPALWQKPPVAPSKLVPDVPQALDMLVMSMLSLDPLARPTSAAAVIDQLTACGELAPDEHELAAESYLASGRMVGRKAELQWVLARVARALAGKGAEAIIEGPAGAGKTRLLQELGLEAQLKGVTVLKADGQAAQGAFGVACALSLSLLEAWPELARRTVTPHAGLLAHLSPELREKLGGPELVELAADQGERRARFQNALFEWFLDATRETTLLLSIDNLQAADDNSAAFLAVLGSKARDTRLIVVAAQRSGDEPVAPVPVRALRKRSGRVRLAGLNADACSDLVRSLFGDVANTGRLAQLLYEKSAGNPQQCMDLIQLLVRKNIVTYAGGTWVLPQQVMPEELPDRVEEILAHKLSHLSPSARALTEVLSVHDKPVPLSRCLILAGSEERAGYAALDELVAEQILLVEGESYRFAQEALRRAASAQMDEGRRSASHVRAAEAALSVAGDSLEVRMEAGFHLLLGGDELRGADLLASTGQAFVRGRHGGESVEHIVQALRAALEVYARHKRSDYEIAGLLFPLLPLAYYSSDWRITRDYGTAAFELGLRITGLSLAYKLRRLIGRKLALVVGLKVAAWRFAQQKKRGLSYDLGQAIAALCGMIPSTMGVFSTYLDAPSTERIREMLEPLSLFGQDDFPALMLAFGTDQMKATQGREPEAGLGFEQIAKRFDTQKVRETLGPWRWKGMYGGALFTRAIGLCYCFGPRALELAREMEGLGVRTWVMGADQIRMLYHAFRGEAEQVHYFRERVELCAVQGGTTWQAEMFWPALLLNSEVLAGDTIAARRTWEQLQRRARDVPSLRMHADGAHAAYLGLRGELAAAIECYEQVLPSFVPQHGVGWQTTRAHFAQTLNWAGQHARAKQVASDALALAQPEDLRFVGQFLELQRQLALAEAGLGHHDQAARQLDALLAKHAAEDNPLLVGLLHKARAEVALVMNDKATFDPQLESMENRFRGTQNPALIAQWEQLAERAVEAGLRMFGPRAHAGSSATSSFTSASSEHRSIAGLTSAVDRNEYALELILQRSRAKTGYLYLLEGDQLRLAAASTPHEPPRAVELELQQLAQRADLEAQELACDPPPETTAPSTRRSAAAVHPRPLEDDGELATVLEWRRGPPSAFASRAIPSVLPSVPSGRPSHDGDADQTVFMPSAAPVPQGGSYRALVLSTQRAGKRLVVGGVLLEAAPHDLFALTPEMLDAIAASLQDRGTFAAEETQA